MSNTIPLPIGPEFITHQGKMIEIVHQRMKIGEKEVTFEIARRSPGVRLLITSSSNKILLTKEYRNEFKDWDYRLPGGKVFDSLEEFNQALESGSDILTLAQKAGQKEALEEVGIEAKNLTHFYTSVCGSSVEWDLYYFSVSLPTEKLGPQHLENGEHITAQWFTFEQASELALSGSMSEDRSAATLMRFLHSSSST